MTAHPSDDYGPNCPACGYGQPWGIDIRGTYDGVLIWECPSCRHQWPRFTQGRWNRQALEIIANWKAAGE
jgi:hypothetical protein